MDIGGELRTARKARMVSIADISRATKIRPSLLRAIESNAFDRIPGGIFTRGYLSAYAREVGLDPDDVVQRFRAEFEAPAEPEPGTSGEPAAVVAPKVAADSSEGSTNTQILQLGVILVVAVACLAFLQPQKPTAPAGVLPTGAAAVSAASSVPSPAAEVPVGTTGSPGTAQPHLAIEIRPHGSCWVDATVDGKHDIARLMNAGDRETITVRDDLTLRVGDPAAFAFSIDGVRGRSLGREGQPVTVRINRQNFGTFLVPNGT